ncbi:phospholipid phosphatase 2-like [Ylistrum balloti]|uniref:phospholipid phosphatase 2-like n=1 Tax=Ylistrum balloti TaxID=509963 RepID=UPI002905B9C2|nr:phospholipid phosphatase 2-like [Ylistrum balloti]
MPNTNINLGRNSEGRTESSIFKNPLALTVDVVSFFIVFIVSLLLVSNTICMKPFERGFFCDDQSLKYPYKDDTISSSLAAVIAIVIFPFVTFFVEPLYAFTRMRYGNISCKDVMKVALKSLYSLILLYMLGIALTQSVVSVMKLWAGRLRPNFFAWCIPEYNATECDVGGGYITDFVCLNNDTKEVDDVKQSFPSGHSSSAVYAFTFVAIYLDIRFRQQLQWRLYMRIIGPSVQTFLVGAGIYICLTRVQDNKHHPTDVIGGAVIGLAICLIMIFGWSRDVFLDMGVRTSEEQPLPMQSYSLQQGNNNGLQNPIMQSNFSVHNAGHDNEVFSVPMPTV